MELAYSDAQIYTSNKRIVGLECRLNADMKNTKFCAHCLDTIVAILNAMHPAFKIIWIYGIQTDDSLDIICCWILIISIQIFQDIIYLDVLNYTIFLP